MFGGDSSLFLGSKSLPPRLMQSCLASHLTQHYQTPPTGPDSPVLGAGGHVVAPPAPVVPAWPAGRLDLAGGGQDGQQDPDHGHHLTLRSVVRGGVTVTHVTHSALKANYRQQGALGAGVGGGTEELLAGV